MKKFRVTYDISEDFYKFKFLHKRFLWFFWVKYTTSKLNFCMSYESVFHNIKKGHINFDGSEIYVYYHIISKPDLHTIEYYDSAEDFKLKNSEHFI
jgi:hypothetical protein